MYLLFKDFFLAFENKQGKEVCRPDTKIFLSNMTAIFFSVFRKSPQEGELEGDF